MLAAKSGPGPGWLPMSGRIDTFELAPAPDLPVSPFRASGERACVRPESHAAAGIAAIAVRPIDRGHTTTKRTARGSDIRDCGSMSMAT